MADGKKPSIRLSRDEAWQMIADSPTGIFTSLRRDGVPISMPLWFEALDERIYFTTRGKKLVRIANDPRSSFLVEAGERWVDLQYPGTSIPLSS
ncbi:MAG: pyridoxamine 5'-phosphate oxidase family protein, partial [Actinomycetota bacterium]